MRPLKPTHDPAPSKLAYRLQRMWLTPLFRFLTLVLLPMSLSAGIGYGVLTQTNAVENTRAYVADIRRTIEQRPEFMVKLMAIDGGSQEVSEDIREILPIDFPVSSFDLDLEELRHRIEELDAVAQASVRVRSGGILQIDLVERTPAVVWRGPQGIELLDREGHRVSALSARSERNDLPLVVGEGAEMAVAEALDLIALAGPLADRIRGLARIGQRRWDVVLDRDQRILLPEIDPGTAFQRVTALDQGYRIFQRDIASLDLRDPTRMTVRVRSDGTGTLAPTTWSNN